MSYLGDVLERAHCRRSVLQNRLEKEVWVRGLQPYLPSSSVKLYLGAEILHTLIVHVQLLFQVSIQPVDFFNLGVILLNKRSIKSKLVADRGYLAVRYF